MIKRYDVAEIETPTGSAVPMLTQPDGDYFLVSETLPVIKRLAKAVINAHDYSSMGQGCECPDCVTAREILKMEE